MSPLALALGAVTTLSTLAGGSVAIRLSAVLRQDPVRPGLPDHHGPAPYFPAGITLSKLPQASAWTTKTTPREVDDRAA